LLLHARRHLPRDNLPFLNWGFKRSVS